MPPALISAYARSCPLFAGDTARSADRTRPSASGKNGLTKDQVLDVIKEVLQ